MIMITQQMTLFPEQTRHNRKQQPFQRRFALNEMKAIVRRLFDVTDGPFDLTIIKTDGVHVLQNAVCMKALGPNPRGGMMPYLWYEVLDEGTPHSYSVYLKDVVGIAVTSKTWSDLSGRRYDESSVAVREAREARQAAGTEIEGYAWKWEVEYDYKGDMKARAFTQAGEEIPADATNPDRHGADCPDPYRHQWLNCLKSGLPETLTGFHTQP